MARVGSILGWLLLIACGPSVQLGPEVTCPNVTLTANAGECDLTPANNQQCSDMHFYEINCGDDGTCTCVVDGQIDGTPVFVSDQTSGFCATLTVSMLHQIAALCADPSHPGDNLNLVSGP